MVKTGCCSFAALFHAHSNDWAKKAMLLADLEQRVRAMIGIAILRCQPCAVHHNWGTKSRRPLAKTTALATESHSFFIMTGLT
jgi:hypothetical protein